MKLPLDIDKIEVSRCKGTSREETMDLCFGISKDGKNKQMMLAELKFNVKKPLNISRSEIVKKISNSLSILSHELPYTETKY